MVYVCIFKSFARHYEIGPELIALIAYVAVLVFGVVAVFIIFFNTFQRRKNQLLLDKINQQKAFDEELAKTQLEIQEETLKHVGRELHDNVGQLLAFATMQLNLVEKSANDDLVPKVSNAQEAVASSLAEVRALSKSLNNDVIFKLGFDKAVENELNRLSNSGLIQTSLISEGEKVNFENNKDEIMLFRILQEFFSNTLKYANAEKLEVNIDYQKSNLILEAQDDGDGFDMESKKNGSGLINMKKRAELINSQYEITSQTGEGTRLYLKYPYRIN